MGDDHNHARGVSRGRAVRILDEQLGRLLTDHAGAFDDEAWLAAEYWRSHHPRERRLQLTRLWLEWVAQHRGPRWTLPGVIVTREGIEFTENADGTGDSVLGYDLGVSLAQNFAMPNGCSWMTPTRVTSGNHVCTDMMGCRAGYPVKFCSFNGDHTPDPRDPGMGSGSWQYQLVWDFFNQF